MIQFLIEKQLILRMTGSAMLSFLLVLLLAPRFIRFLLRKKVGDRPDFNHAALNGITRHKSATPTMGGILIALAILLGTLMFAYLRNFYIRMAVFCLIWLGTLGAADDWIKLRAGAKGGGRDGLRMWEKILFQIGLAVMLAIFIYSHGRASDYVDFAGRTINAVRHFYLPFKADPIAMAPLAFILITVVTMVGSSNAVNLTDGMDGLAGGCMLIVAGVFLVLAWVAGNETWANFFHLPFVPQAAELAIVCAAVIGSCLGFLWYNCNPAQVFMGDTGSLPLGGLIGYVAVVARQEPMLLIAGGVFVMEALSVLLQISYYKATKGKRIFRCAPIHHHFHLGGWSESKVVVRFWLLSVIFAALALATLKLR
ncbi:MAG: phospho-N-acetylmuramoyl-pentapeptide-transferase [Planctomycetes bacterium]|nr:phospho-N-acetylmuramoyl-pentapeptide-transferase [Planctomycetota bacterium]